MDERDQASTSGGGHELASEVGERVRSIISAAEAAANAVRHEAEQEAAVRRRVAEEEARRIIEDAKADADAYLAERIRRISELSDTVVERAETIVSRLDRAEEVRQQLQTLADALGESAERLATEVRVGTPPPTVRSPSAAPPPGETDAPVPPESRDEPTGAAPAPQPPPPEASERQPVPETPIDVEPVPPAPPDPSAAVAEPEPDIAPTDVLPPEPPAEPEGPAAAPEETGEDPDVVRLERREEPPTAEAEAEAPGARREADQQLGARLVALQMAVAGGNRGEVEVHLRRTFDLADPSSILDDVFGQGTDAEKRVAWPRTGDGAA